MISGRKKSKEETPAVIPPLVQLCSQRIRDTIHLNCIKHQLSVVPNELLELLLVGCGPDQLTKIESHAQRDLSYVTEDIWQLHCRNFLNKEIDDFGSAPSWREYYQILITQMENKKIQLGKHLRSMYDEKQKEKASKKIKMLDSAPVNRSKSLTKLGTTYTGYNKPVSKNMEKCLKDMRKTQASMAWRKPVVTPPPQKVILTKTLPAPRLQPTNSISMKPATMSNLHKPQSHPPLNSTKPSIGQTTKPNSSFSMKSSIPSKIPPTTTSSFPSKPANFTKPLVTNKPVVNNTSSFKPTLSSSHQNTISKPSFSKPATPIAKPGIPNKSVAQSTNYPRTGQTTSPRPGQSTNSAANKRPIF